MMQRKSLKFWKTVNFPREKGKMSAVGKIIFFSRQIGLEIGLDEPNVEKIVKIITGSGRLICVGE